MAKRYRGSRKKSLLTKTTELALAVPQVVAHRVTRMAQAGTSPSASDRKEFQLMGLEKLIAFGASWGAMALQAMLASQALVTSHMLSLWSPFGRRPSAGGTALQLQRAALGILDKGLVPVHRKAVANAKRLERVKGRSRGRAKSRS
jgi:hypothetical protein